VAGNVTALSCPITDQAVAERLRAGGPWVKAVLRTLLPRPWVATLPQERRLVVIDARSIQAPGATGTAERWHSSMDVVSLEFLEGSIPEVHTGETLQHFALGPGDVAITDRGYAPPLGMWDAIDRGAALIVRLHPCSVVLCDTAGPPLQLGDALQRQRADTIRTLPVVLRSASGDGERRGWVHA
jgi:hypothetical protein